MVHQQNSARGVIGKKRIDITESGELYFHDYSNNTALLTANSTGTALFAAGLSLSGQTSPFSQDSTALMIPGGLSLSGKCDSTALTQNTTGTLLPAGLTLSGQASFITQDSTALLVPGKIALSGKCNSTAISQNATGTVFPAELKVSNNLYIGANTTGYKFTTVSAKPAVDGGSYKLALVLNSTGAFGLAINTTGTTWMYCRMTAVINTT